MYAYSRMDKYYWVVHLLSYTSRSRIMAQVLRMMYVLINTTTREYKINK